MKNELLSKKQIEFYDYIKMKNIILDIYELFPYLERVDNNVATPIITIDYRVRYEQFVPVSSSHIENFILRDEMLKTRNEYYRKELLSKITMALRTLNTEELEVFDLVFYKKKTEEEISKIISCCIDKERYIKKSGCIKFLTALGLDIECLK